MGIFSRVRHLWEDTCAHEKCKRFSKRFFKKALYGQNEKEFPGKICDFRCFFVAVSSIYEYIPSGKKSIRASGVPSVIYCDACSCDVKPVFSDEKPGISLCPGCGSVLDSGFLSDKSSFSDGVLPVVNPLSSDDLLVPGTDINGFQVVKELGRGAMGVVYLAKQVNLERFVALKVLSRELAGDTAYVEGFFREARSAASLSHPNIVQAYDAGVSSGGVCFFVMELIDGENLDTLIAREGAIELKKGLEIARKIADAMNYAWVRNKLSHGDIKPENIILKNDGEAKLADLGLARDHRQPKTEASKEIHATPAYAAPEVIRGELNKIDFRSDMYSFGATLYQMFTGKPPFDGDDPFLVCEKQLNEQPKPLIGVNPALPNSLSMLVDRLMEKSPRKRPDMWADVVIELDQIMQEVERQEPRKGKVVRRHSDSSEVQRRLDSLRRRQKMRQLYAGIGTFFFLMCILVGGLLAMRHFDSADDNPDLEAVDPEDGSSVFGGAVPDSDEVTPPVPTQPVPVQPVPNQPNPEEEALKRKLHVFRSRITATCRRMNQRDLAKDGSMPEVMNAIADLNALFDSAERDPDLHAPGVFPEAERDRLVKYRANLFERKKHLENPEPAQKSDPPSQTEKPVSPEETVDTSELQKEASAAFGKILDSLRKVKTPKESATAIAAIDEWSKNFGGIASKSQASTMQEVKSFLQDAWVPLSDILQKNQKALVGLRLFPNTYPQYLFLSADASVMKFEMTSDNVRYRYSISHNKLNAAETNRIIGEVFVSNPRLGKLTPESQAILFKRVTVSRINVPEFLQKFRKNTSLPDAEIKKLERIRKYFIRTNS